MSTELKPTVEKKKSSRSRRIVAAKYSEVISFEAVGFSDLESEEEGEGDDISYGLIRTGTEIIKEKESVDKLCHSIVDHFWDSAWSICAERFYFGNAPLAISLELRNTWLRILEAEWLDQDQPQMNFSPDVFQSDDPPPPLVIESPSTELFLNSRPLPKRLQVESSLGGSGEPLASVVSVASKKSKKTKSKSKRKNKTRKNKSKVKVKSKSKKGVPAKALSLKKSTGLKKSGGKSKPKKTKFKPEESKEPNVSKAESEAEEEEEDEQVPPECVPPDPPKPEVPWEVLFLNKQVFMDESNVSPTLSEEYRHLGVEPWNPAKSGGSTGVFRPSNQSSCALVPPSKNMSLKGSTRMSTTEPQADPEEDLELEGETEELEIRKSTIVIKKGELLESTEAPPQPDPSAVNVLERMDNLLVADSDHVVDILRPTEAERIQRDVRISSGKSNISRRSNILPKKKSLARKSTVTKPQQPKKPSDIEKQRIGSKSAKPSTTQSIRSSTTKGTKGKAEPVKPTKAGPKQV